MCSGIRITHTQTINLLYLVLNEGYIVYIKWKYVHSIEKKKNFLIKIQTKFTTESISEEKNV